MKSFHGQRKNGGGKSPGRFERTELATSAIVTGRSLNWRDFLRSHPLLSALGADLLERMSARAIVRKVKRGATIFRKGDPGNSLFAVCSGSVKISAPSSDGKDA